jgi:DUF438 domain-containing protein
MKLTVSTKIEDLLKEYPFLEEFLPTVSPKYKKLTNPVVRKTMGKIATLNMVAKMGEMEFNTLARKIQDEIKRVALADPDRLQKEGGSKNAEGSEGAADTGERVSGSGPRATGSIVKDSKDAEDAPSPEPRTPGPGDDVAEISPEKLEALKGIIKDLHDGAELEELKQRFAELVKDVSPTEISQMEQRLIEEGMPEEEVKRLCDVHVEVFKHSLEEQEVPKTPAGHPVHTLMEENRASEKIIDDLNLVLSRIGSPPNEDAYKYNRTRLKGIVDKLWEIDKHYLRKENQLFPKLEAHGVAGPSSVMWAIHDDIRERLKIAKAHIEEDNVDGLVPTLTNASEMIKQMIYKEEHILYPMSLEVLSGEEWVAVRNGEEELGYAWITPSGKWPVGDPGVQMMQKAEVPKEAPAGDDKLKLYTGALSREQINLVLNFIPMDITFVDANDEVAYYTAGFGDERIFPRSPGIIGRKVQKCHPARSVNVVENILDEFKSGKKSVAEFWVEVGGRLVHIRYFAVRDKEGKYKGTLEASQDITDIKKLEGQRRLLDWTES